MVKNGDSIVIKTPQGDLELIADDRVPVGMLVPGELMPKRAVRGARGFASMDPERRSQIARLGGLAAHAQGVAHEFTPEEAREAGKLGGQAVAKDRAYMAEIGRRGGAARKNMGKKRKIGGAV